MPRLTRLALPAALILAACADSTGPDRGNPAQYIIPNGALFTCRQWVGGAPAVELGLFDVYFGSQGEGPTEQQVRGVTTRGGTVIRTFHVPGLRAILPIRIVPALDALEVRSVSDLAVLTQDIAVGFYGASDPAIVTNAGGRVRGFFDHTMIADVPDDGIPSIRRNPLVRYVELGLGGCFSFGSLAAR